jgi:proteasome accessory factor B
MQNSAKIKRYFRIIEFVQNHPKPTPKLLKERLEDDGFIQSKRTIERALEEIRNEFFIDINYDRKKKQYVVSDEEEGYTQQLIRYFKLNYQAETLVSNLGNSKKLSNNISYDFEKQIQGTQFIGDILETISSKRTIKITHQKFEDEEARERILAPYLLKEFKGRWYILGEVLHESEKLKYQIFGLDRITDVKPLLEKFKPTIKNPKNYFKDIIGVSGWTNKLEKIKIEFFDSQGKFIKSLPIHESQVVLEDNKEKFVIQLEIKPNYEFYQLMLGYGPKAKVIEPKHVKERIVNELKKSLKLYE